jgi:hypothetical protein
MSADLQTGGSSHHTGVYHHMGVYHDGVKLHTHHQSKEAAYLEWKIKVQHVYREANQAAD